MLHSERDGKTSLPRLVWLAGVGLGSLSAAVLWVVCIALFIVGVYEERMGELQLWFAISSIGLLYLATRVVSKLGIAKLLFVGPILVFWITAATFGMASSGLEVPNLGLARTLVVQMVLVILMLLLTPNLRDISHDIEHWVGIGKRIFRENKETRRN